MLSETAYKLVYMRFSSQSSSQNMASGISLNLQCETLALSLVGKRVVFWKYASHLCKQNTYLSAYMCLGYFRRLIICKVFFGFLFFFHPSNICHWLSTWLLDFLPLFIGNVLLYFIWWQFCTYTRWHCQPWPKHLSP